MRRVKSEGVQELELRGVSYVAFFFFLIGVTGEVEYWNHTMRAKAKQSLNVLVCYTILLI